MNSYLTCAAALTSFAVLASHAPPRTLSAELQDARAEYRALVQEHGQAVEEFRAELERLRSAGKEAEAETYEESWNPTPAFVDQFAEKASEYSGSEDAVMFLQWIVQNDDTAGDELTDAATSALDTLVDQYRESESFASFVRSGGYLVYDIGKPRTVAILDHLVACGADDVANPALFARGVARLVLGDATDAEQALARADLTQVAGLGEEDELASQAKGYLFELDHLQIGQVAPDIEERDLDGVAFKLSDYRGKVVMLDFWGDW